ncbi:MAG: hypothetical protein OXH03_10545 [Bacteroidetes bacterium]|nr:hypothetical protein [Bacteroidota bacterium]MDE2671325.1 hypothetical protein [Bacteroidota bacterium]
MAAEQDAHFIRPGSPHPSKLKQATHKDETPINIYVISCYCTGALQKFTHFADWERRVKLCFSDKALAMLFPKNVINRELTKT